MKCPNCGNEMQKGVLRVTNAGSLTDMLTMAIWYSDEENKKEI